jgi:Thaumatin family
VYYADAPVSYTEIAGCMSACNRYIDAKYCCTGGDNTPNKCRPSRFSKPFKEMCPDVYTYVYDDAMSTFASNKGPRSSFEGFFCPGTYPHSKCANNLRWPLNRLSPWRCWKITVGHRGLVWTVVALCTIFVCSGV